MNKSEELIKEFREKTKTPIFDEIDDVKHILCPRKEYLATLTADECFTNCMTLMTYKAAYQNIVNEVASQKIMLQKYLNQQYAKYWHKAPEMLPKEIHYAWLNNDQQYLMPIVKQVNVLEVYLKESEGRIADISRSVSFYESKGKAIQWNK